MKDLRHVARGCLEAALLAVEPRRLVSSALRTVSLAGPVTVAAIGKAAAGMAAGAIDVLGEKVGEGLVVVPRGGIVGELPDDFSTLFAGHPLPDSESVWAAERLRALAERSASSGTFLVLLSGGASALVVHPVDGVSLEEIQSTTRMLLEAGASIDELNAVRKHLEQLKGGRLARLTRANRVLALVLSDVVGDRLDVIASGPVAPDATTFADAIDAIRLHGHWGQVSESVRRHLSSGRAGRREESPAADDACFQKVECRIVGNNRMALESALAEAERAGFESRHIEAALEGEAREAGRSLGRMAKELVARRSANETPVCLVAGGETTVTVTGSGKGGRNQELALAAALEIGGSEGILVTAFGTDGCDGPTDAAGAWVDGRTVERARALGIDGEAVLDANDAYRVFAALDDLIITGPTGTNVMDLALVFVA